MSPALIHKCQACHEYTLHPTCGHCGGKAVVNRPPKYSPEDPYGKYRRQMRKADAADKAAGTGGHATKEHS